VSVEVACPACGATISFKIGSSAVVICEYCNSVVARGDRKFEDLGKVADLVETGSVLDVDLAGVYHGVPFQLTGRAQLEHESGGLWDEWYAAFADGRWGWLAEAQGRFYFTFEQYLPEQTLIPPFESLQLGQPVAAIPSSVPLVVAETGEAEARGAKGEIPYRLVPGEHYLYADLSGPHGEFATIDYSQQPPLVFIGREVPFAELGFPETARAPEREARRVAGVQLSCPQCGGPLDLRAPDQTLRVTCPNCSSLLDVSQGKLEFLQALEPRVKPIIPIGSVGEFAGAKLMVIGFVLRSVEFSGVRYFWEEYLLYNPQVGFRWLVRSDDNWNFVQTVPPGAVDTSGFGGNKFVRFNGQSFKLYQDAILRVDHVIGEFYWMVTVGELVRGADYVKPPLMLSKEVSVTHSGTPADGGQEKGKRKKRIAPVETGEVNWSLGTFVPVKEVEKAFGITGLPRTSKIAPNQLYAHKKVYKYWLLLLLAAFVLGLGMTVTGAHRKVFEQTYQFQPLPNSEGSQSAFTDPIELKARQNIKVTASAAVDNSWLAVDGDFIDETTGDVQTFSLPVEYYHGVDDGESWSEGSQTPSVHLSALPAGKYTMRIEAQWEKWQQPAAVTIRVEQGVPRVSYWLVTMLLISIIPVLVAFNQLSFEKRRWADSDYTPFSSE
jgi:DNA-directed RNA polymerase subunit RPC12/RpoP